jgi:hypothetical protein
MKKLLGIVVLGLFLSTNAFSYTMTKKEFGEYCVEYTKESFDEQKIEITSQISKRIKENCKCQRRVFKSIPDNDWNSFDNDKKVELFTQAITMCGTG